MNLRIEAARLRKVLEDHNWRMDNEEYDKLKLAHMKLLKQDPPTRKNHPFLLFDYLRLVVGAHGPYYEFKQEHLAVKLEVTKGQEWRVQEKYNHVKYIHLNPVGRPDIKVYLQKKTVRYADYKPDHMYVDYWIFDEGVNDDLECT